MRKTRKNEGDGSTSKAKYLILQLPSWLPWPPSWLSFYSFSCKRPVIQSGTLWCSAGSTPHPKISAFYHQLLLSSLSSSLTLIKKSALQMVILVESFTPYMSQSDCTGLWLTSGNRPVVRSWNTHWVIQIQPSQYIIVSKGYDCLQICCTSAIGGRHIFLALSANASTLSESAIDIVLHSAAVLYWWVFSWSFKATAPMWSRPLWNHW